MKERFGVFAVGLLLLFAVPGRSELIPASDCRAWLEEFEAELLRQKPEFAFSSADDPSFMTETYSFGTVKRRGQAFVCVSLCAPAMADCRDGYVGMPFQQNFEWDGADLSIPVQTCLFSWDPPAFFWIYTEEGRLRAAEWVTMSGDEMYTLTYLLRQDGVIREIRFRLDKADAKTQRELLETADRLRESEPARGNVSPGAAEPFGGGAGDAGG